MDELREKVQKYQRALLALNVEVEIHDRLLTTLCTEQDERTTRLHRLCRKTNRLRMRLLHLEEQEEARQTPTEE